MPAPATTDIKPTHKFPTRLALSLAGLAPDTYHPNGQLACITFTHILHPRVTYQSTAALHCKQPVQPM